MKKVIGLTFILSVYIAVFACGQADSATAGSPESGSLRGSAIEAPLEGLTIDGQSSSTVLEPSLVGINTENVQGEAEEPRRPDVIFVPTPQEVVDKMLELAQVKKSDLVYDLGCGDGRIVVTAAKKFGCKAVGYDIDPQRIKESKENVAKNNVGDLVTIEQKDIFTLDLSKANVVTLYLLPSLNVKLIPQLEKLKPGSRIVSHDFDMRGVKPDKVVTVTSADGYGEHTVYFWTTPLKKEGEQTPVSNVNKQEAQKEPEKFRNPDVIFVPTPQDVVDKMLELAQVKKSDLVYDLGCGDARIVVSAAKKFGCKAFGYDIDPQRIKESKENVAKNNVGDLVTIEQKDIFKLDLSKANVVTLYLLPSLNVKLIPQLEKLKPGSRIVSHDFNMQGVRPDKVIKVDSKEDNRQHTVYLWTAPIKKEKVDENAGDTFLETFAVELNEEEESSESRTPDVIFVPTPQEVVDKMLEMAQVKKSDLVYDLGCGDGRIVVTAAKKFGCKAFGYDIDPQRIKESKENVAKNNVGDLVTIEQKDIFKLDLSKANVITLYLLPSLNVKLIPQLEKLKPGSRIVSHDFDMKGVKPDKVVTVTPEGGYREHEVYLWTAPLKKE